MSQKWKTKVLEVKRVSDWLLTIKLKISENMVNIVSAYGLQVGCDEDEKEGFLEDLIGEMSEKEELVIGGDLNGHVGKETDGYFRVHGGRGYGERNEEGRRILDMAQRNDLMVRKTIILSLSLVAEEKASWILSWLSRVMQRT